eukprot:TRINITY_DN9000_c2_g1_i5.p1 TRINITY_DN9000_c2_g1~~TRINITY_DN9000_c2_g1_i5.p1  ORF type:complete len:236 (-),score=-13.28 TRINITY_DN9000_c2_g1_i5:722-1429(-)
MIDQFGCIIIVYYLVQFIFVIICSFSIFFTIGCFFKGLYQVQIHCLQTNIVNFSYWLLYKMQCYKNCAHDKRVTFQKIFLSLCEWLLENIFWKLFNYFFGLRGFVFKLEDKICQESPFLQICCTFGFLSRTSYILLFCNQMLLDIQTSYILTYWQNPPHKNQFYYFFIWQYFKLVSVQFAYRIRYYSNYFEKQNSVYFFEKRVCLQQSIVSNYSKLRLCTHTFWLVNILFSYFCA